MAAALVAGLHEFFFVRPDGVRKRIWSYRSEAIGPTGQNMDMEKQMSVPVTADWLAGGTIDWIFTSDATATSDTTDCIIRIPAVRCTV